MPDILINLGPGTNPSGYNQITLAAPSIAAGSVVDETGAVVAGVSISSPTPFTADGQFDGTGVFDEIPNLVEDSLLRTGTNATLRVSGLSAGEYTVRVFGSRDLSTSYPATMAVNGRSAVGYNAGNTGDFAAHTATDTLTITSGQDLDVVIANNGGAYAYANEIRITPTPGPELTSIDTDDILVDGQQNFTATVSNIPTGEVPTGARIGSVAGVGGTSLTGFSAATTANAGEFICTMDLTSGIVTGSTSVVSELSIDYGPV